MNSKSLTKEETMTVNPALGCTEEISQKIMDEIFPENLLNSIPAFFLAILEIFI